MANLLKYPLLFLCMLLLAFAGKQEPQPLHKENKAFKFLASADPQYAYEDLRLIFRRPGVSEIITLDGTEAARSNHVFARMFQKMEADDSYRGLIIAGDLTHNSKAIEIAHYQQLIERSGRSGDIYEGLGNHDYFNPNPQQIKECASSWDDCHVPGEIREFVRKKARNTAVSLCESSNRQFEANGAREVVSWKKGLLSPHYSWDWEGVHFVQLNLYPGEGEGQKGISLSEEGESCYYHPFNSLAYLKEDLEKNVGKSHRPVILIHHYGFDEFSINNGWWTATERAAYWDAIAPYNIAAILTGHKHAPAEIFHIPWSQPDSAQQENRYYQQINTYLVGGMRNGGAWSEFELTEGNLFARKYQGPDTVPVMKGVWPVNSQPR